MTQADALHQDEAMSNDIGRDSDAHMVFQTAKPIGRQKGAAQKQTEAT